MLDLSIHQFMSIYLIKTTILISVASVTYMILVFLSVIKHNGKTLVSFGSGQISKAMAMLSVSIIIGIILVELPIFLYAQKDIPSNKYGEVKQYAKSFHNGLGLPVLRSKIEENGTLRYQDIIVLDKDIDVFLEKVALKTFFDR